MAEETKTVAEWEKTQGVFLLGDVKANVLKQTMNVKDFMALADETGFTSVEYKLRVQWLERCGYEVTRENLLNADLPTITKE
jgi:hypothetical protein